MVSVRGIRGNLGKGGPQLLADPSLIVLLVLLALLASCSLPKIVVLEDTLTAEGHNDLGYIYEEKGMNALADKEYSLAGKKRRGWYLPLFNRGNLAFKAGEYGKAEEYFREALRRAPENGDVMNNLANALMMQGRRQEALWMIEQALRVEGKKEYLETREEIRKHGSATARPAEPGGGDAEHLPD